MAWLTCEPARDGHQSNRLRLAAGAANSACNWFFTQEAYTCTKVPTAIRVVSQTTP
jgi:hypothetical protein